MVDFAYRRKTTCWSWAPEVRKAAVCRAAWGRFR